MKWPRDGIPASPRAWLISTGRFKAIDRLRRRARFDTMLGELAARLDDRAAPDPAEQDDQILDDDRLRPVFTCCHPALPPDAQIGPYGLQAAIAAAHAEAPAAAATDWDRIVGLYDLLARADPSPVIELNRAVAVSMRDGPSSGLALIDAILERGLLDAYHLAHAARADLLRRLGRTADARAAYQRALELTRQEPERRFIEQRLNELARGPGGG